MVEATDLEELQCVLLDMRTRVDAHNREQGTDYYIMVGLCTYFRQEKHRHSDTQIASANAMICAFNSFLSKRAMIDLNRYLLDQEVGRPLSIKGEHHWKVDQSKFEDTWINTGMLCIWYE